MSVSEARQSCLTNRTVLVTGGTGSFGKAFVDLALNKYHPKRIIIFSRDELKQLEMRQSFKDPRLTFFLGDIRDKDRTSRAFEADVDIVIHAAALKQVPACEYNPFEAIKTNVLGAKNIIDAAIDCRVPRVVALSTDKAVNPVNLYGATKLCAEKLFVQGNSYAGGRATRFSCVRYGNVLGSRGSVVPIFLAQSASGKVSVTDRRMTRFWLTLSQAVELVVHCIEIMKGGEVFVPHIPSMKILEMARTLGPECEIEFTGIRPGEKLHEMLLSSDEARHAVRLGNLFIIKPEYPHWGSSNWTEASPLPDGFIFSSDSNDRWLSPSDLLKLIGETTDESEVSSRGR